MSSPDNESRQIQRAKILTDDQEFEWLLCLASTFQAYRRLPSIEVEQAQWFSRPKRVAAAVRAWLHWPQRTAAASGFPQQRRSEMRFAILLLVNLLFSAPFMTQGTDTDLHSELETLHAKWMKAFDSGDGGTMDQIEVDNLTLVGATGARGPIWTKTTPRNGKQPKREPQTERTLSNVSVRRFGDTAILTGILTTKSASENSQDATTVVFVQSSGKWKIASAQWTPVVNTK